MTITGKVIPLIARWFWCPGGSPLGWKLTASFSLT